MTNLEALKIQHHAQRRMLAINQALDIAELRKTGEQDAMVDPKVAAIAKEFDDATNVVAARIQRVIDEDAALSAESEAVLRAQVTRLQGLGADPETPVPPAPVEV